jgi:hypothetical protein
MNGIGTLPPGLAGWVLGDQINQQKRAGQMQEMQGILGLQGMLEQQEINRTLKPLQLQQLRIAVQQAQQNADLRRQLQSGMTGAPATAPVFGEGGVSLPGGGHGNVNTGQVVPPQRPAQGGIPPHIASMLLSGDSGLGAYAKAELERNKPIAAREGAPVINPATGQILFYAPKLEAGMSPSFSGGQVTGVQNIPGYVPAMTERTTAQEGAKAGFDLVQVPDGRGGTVMMPRSQAVQRLGGQAAAAPQQPSAPTVTPPGMQIPPDVQARRDADAARIRTAEAQPNGGGMLPTSSVLGSAPSEATQAADKERQVRAVQKRGELPQAQLTIQTQIDDLNRLTSLANEIIKDPALDRAVGLVGAAPSMPGGQAANAGALIDSLRAQISGMKLQAMRNASKTGGAVGNVTEKEWPRLESMVVALSNKMSPEKFREKVSELITEINKSKENILRAFQEEYGEYIPQRRNTDAANDPLGIRGRR